MQWVWVTIAGTGTAEDRYRPNIPRDVRYRYDDSIPRDEVGRNPHAVQYANVGIEDADIPKCETVAEADVPLSDRLLIEMIRTCRGHWADKAEVFFDRVPKGTEAEKNLCAWLLYYARKRFGGLSAEHAVRLARKYGLENAKPVKG